MGDGVCDSLDSAVKTDLSTVRTGEPVLRTKEILWETSGRVPGRFPASDPLPTESHSFQNFRPAMASRVPAFLSAAGLVLASLAGCALPTAVSNPVLVRGSSPDGVWEKAVEVLHSYQMPIERENRLDGTIETDYTVGSGLLEPWHHDSVTVGDRLESSFQSIRRKAKVSITPAQDGYLVGVEVLKEIEDPQDLIVNSAGTATFPESTTFDRKLELVVGPATPNGWVLLGRDQNLEQSLLNSLQQACSQP